MNIANIIIILVIIGIVIGIISYYVKALSKVTDEIEYDAIYSLKYLTDGVAQEFADTQRENVAEQNLSKQQLEAARRKKLELRRSLKTAAFGDAAAKKFIKSFIKDIIQSKKFNVNSETIDLVIPFNHFSALDGRSKADIVQYIYLKLYGDRGFAQMFNDYNLKEPKNISSEMEEEGSLSYEITSEDMDEIFHDIMTKYTLSYEDKLEIVAQRIFADYKGFGVVDQLFEFAIDEIDCGVSGVPKGSFDLKKDMMTEDFEYSFNSIYVVYSGINYKLSCLTFGTQEELVRICQNIYKYSAPYALSRKTGKVVASMKDGSRISVARPPAAGGWAFFARKFDSTPSKRMEDLITDTGCEIPITVIKWLMRASKSTAITGEMGSGKSTTLKSMVRYFPSEKSIRVYEMNGELNLQFTYPKRNIVSFTVTESITMQDLYDFGKKTNANISIIGESASAEMGVIVIQSSTVGSECALFTHHAKTTEDLVLSLRDNLTSCGGYSSEKVAEEVVSKCINFNVHMGRKKGHRYIERITEIIPVRDHSYPYDGKNITDDQYREDTVEYYKRVTDRQTFITKDIVRFVNDHYEMVNPISSEMKLSIANFLAEDDEKLFANDMSILEELIK